MFLVKKKEVSLVQLESLLDALVKETDTLTESQIEDVTYIQDIIKQDSKIILSEDANIKYQEFIEKVMLFDDSLQEGIIDKFSSHIKGINETKYKELEEKILKDAQSDPKEKAKMLEQIDDLFSDANTKLGAGLIGLVVRLFNKKDREGYKNRLLSLRNKIEAIK